MEGMHDGLTLEERCMFGLNKGLVDVMKPHEANLFLRLYDPNGKLKEYRAVHNQVQTQGLDDIANILSNGQGTSLKALAGWMEVGSSSGQGVGTNTLATYITGGSGNRTACSPANGTLSGLTVVYAVTFAAGYGTGAITEIGLFNVVTANTGDMWLYSSFSVVNKAAGDSLACSWTLTI